MDLQSLLALMGKNVDNQNKLVKDSTAQTSDELNMQMHPDLQGPHVGFNSPQQAALTDHLGNAVIGSINSVQKLAPLTMAEKAAGNIANEAIESGAAMPMVNQTQQALSRAADYADRAAQQRYASLKNKLNQYRGQ